MIAKQQIILIDYMADCEFETICQLGKGSYGEVYKVRRRSDLRQYALKKVKIVNLKQKDKQNTLNQVRILASVDHPNIVQYREAIFDENRGELALIMELAHGGDLAEKIKTRFNSGQTFAERQIWKYGAGILEGLQYLHQMGVIHRDIKPANILFTVDDVPQISDLNVARELTKGLAHSQTGTPNYASPEIWDNQSYGAQCDIWSFGCIIYELCTFRSPFRSKNFDQLYQKVQSLHYDPVPTRYSLTLESTIKKCLQKKQKRIKLDQLLGVFRKQTSHKEIKRSCSAGSLIKNIQMPLNIKNISSVLPSSRYAKRTDASLRKTQVSLNPQQDQSQRIPNILDKYMKQKNPLLNKLNKARALNNRIYTEHIETPLLPSRSEALLKERPELRGKSRREEQLKMMSFKQVLDSLEEVRISDRVAKVGLRKRNIRYGLKLY